MEKFISRSEIHKDLVAEINKDIEFLRTKTRDDQYLSTIIKTLNEIDSEYFNEIITEVKKTFDLTKYYIDRDKNKEVINPEIPHIIESYLNELLLLSPQSNLTSQSARIKASGQLSPTELTTISLQEKANRLRAIEQQAKEQLQSLIAKQNSQNLAHSDFEPKVIAGLIKQNEHYSTKEILKSTEGLMKKELIKTNVQKNRYKINIKWFWIGMPILLVGMILAIILPLFI